MDEGRGTLGRNTAGHWVLQVAGLAVAYAVVGRLSLLLAIPPGYASPVWPAAGIALAAALLWGARVWPGIVLGSFLVNLWTGLDASSGEALAKSILLPVGIGSGAALQAIVGAWLIRRLVGWPHALNTGASVTQFLLLAGPASCLVNATIGPGCLLLIEAIPQAKYLVTWSTWWVGDALGVVVCAPLLLLWLSTSVGSSRARRWLVTVPLGSTLALAIAVFIGVRAVEGGRLREEFQSRASHITQTFTQAINRYLQVMYGLEAFYVNSGSVTPEAFHGWVATRLSRDPTLTGLQALSWNRRVVDGDRATFEATMAHALGRAFQITERDPQGQLVPAGRRAEYVTVAYIEPFEGNEKALGLDIASDPVRADALRRATDSGQPAVTSRITLVQERGQQFSVLLLVPVYAHQGVTERVDGRRRLPEGFLVGVFRLGDLIASVLERVPYRDMAVTVLDATAPPQEQLLMTMQLGQAPTSVVPRQESPQGRLGPLWATTIEVADRRWELRFHPTPAYVTTFRTWEVWVVLIGGLLFTGLLGGMLLVGTGRASVVERLVAERTVALERADWERRQALDQLAGRNRDLEMVLRVTSHDLKEPLRAVESFSQMIHENYATRFDAEGQDLLRRIVRATARLRLLLDEILTLSRTRHITVPMEQIDGRAIVDKVLERLEAAIREKRATVRVDERLPRLRVDQTWAVQAVYNLVLNALKFTKDQHPPEVEIGVYQAQPGEPPGQGFVVRDRGPGVAPAHRERIFELFQRAVGREVEGTGAGLAIVREVATRHGGAAWMRPREGGGSEFIITFGTTMGNPVP